MLWTNKYNLPAQLAKQIIQDAERDAYENLDRPMGIPEVRVTELQQPPYVRYLKRTFADKITQDVADAMPLWLGSRIHEALRGQDGPDVVYEYQISYDFNIDGHPIRVLGTVDEFWPQKRLIIDNKTAFVQDRQSAIKPDYVAQLNIYAYLLRLHESKQPFELQIRYIYKDWAKARTAYQTDTDYPKAMVETRVCPVWPKAQVEQYLYQRLSRFIVDKPPICLPEERDFPDEKCWKVKTPGAQRALRAFDTQQQAQDFVSASMRDDLTIVYEGKDKICRLYCSVRSVCPYAQSMGYNQNLF